MLFTEKTLFTARITHDTYTHYTEKIQYLQVRASSTKGPFSMQHKK